MILRCRRRGHRGVGVRRRRAAAALRGPPRARGRGRHRRHPGRHARRRPLPEPRRGVRRSGLRAVRRRSARRARHRLPRVCPTAPRRRSCPSCVDRVGHVVDLAADFRLDDADAVPRVVRRGPRRARPARRVRLRPARVVPREITAARRRRRARLLPDGGDPGARAAGRAPGWSRPRASSSTRPAACRAPGGGKSTRSAAPTRTSSPTGCSTTGTRRRSSRQSPRLRQGDQVLFTPHLAPMNRGILATCYARPTAHDLDRRPARLPGRRVRRRAVRRRDRRLAVDQGDPRLQHRPRHGALRRAHRLGAGAVARSTTW